MTASPGAQATGSPGRLYRKAGEGEMALEPKPYIELEERVAPLVRELVEEVASVCSTELEALGITDVWESRFPTGSSCSWGLPRSEEMVVVLPAYRG